jgi:cytochrome c oxidase cbb3-type subunit III
MTTLRILAFSYAVLMAAAGAASFALAQTPPRTVQGGKGGGNAYTIYDEAVLNRGKSLFAGQCGFCHGSNAKGGESGPSLLRAVPVLDDKDGELVGPIILNGRIDKGMPKFNLSQQQITEIAAFLHEGIRAAAQRGTYQVLNIVTGDAKKGAAYFNGAGRCNTCHSVTGDLKGIAGRYDPVELQGKFLMPRLGGPATAASSPHPVMVTVTLASGAVLNGKLERIDDFNLSLTDAGGDYHSINRDGDNPRVVLADPMQAHLDLITKYTDADMHNITAYLETLK